MSHNVILVRQLHTGVTEKSRKGPKSFVCQVIHILTPGHSVECSQDVSVEAACIGTVVTYQTPTITGNSNETLTVECEPPSGSEFPIGKTNVICVARDSSGNHDTCQFQVELKGKYIIVSSRYDQIDQGRNHLLDSQQNDNMNTLNLFD